MRTAPTNMGITIQYPEDLVFTGNRNIITITGSVGYSNFTIYGDTREFINGVGEFNLQPYWEALFESEDRNSKFSYKTSEIILFVDGEPIQALDFTYIFWGKNRIFDVRKLPKTGEYTDFSKWFDFWLDDGVDGKINGVDYSFVKGYNSLDLSAYNSDIIVLIGGTFDDTFDTSFSLGVDSFIISKINCAENGILLRWLDHWGIWQQKVFEKLSENIQTKGDSYNWNKQNPEIFYNGLQFSEKKETDSFDIQVPSCDLDECERLADICTSDFVCVYDFTTSTWLPVVVSTNEIKIKQNTSNQPINLTIVLQNGY